jgi:hypothetical protein
MILPQNKLEQLFKEYLELKNYIQEESKNIEALKKEVADKALELFTIEDKANLYFETIGEKEILKIDFLELQKKLYYFYEAYKDLVEIPIEIVNEFIDYKIKGVFALKNGKKEIIDKELYNFYKKQHQDYTLGVEEYNKLIQGAQ